MNGTVLDRKYEVIGVVGEGGMGVVHRVRRVSDGLNLALKLLREEFIKDPDAMARFHREARAAIAMKSPHVARIYDIGTIETGQPYIVMELLEGHDLGQEIEKRGAIPHQEAAWYVAQAAYAMIEAHELGIVHRDLKPPNLFLTGAADGRRMVKVLDFGISKVSKLMDAHVTSTQMSFGTPLYMSPEQIRSTKLVDARSDVWSLGVILYEALTGQPPFIAETAGALAVVISVEDYIPPSQALPGVPIGIDGVIAGALKKNPKDRYPSMTEFLRALEEFVPGRGASVDSSSPRPKSRTLEMEVQKAQPATIQPVSSTPQQIQQVEHRVETVTPPIASTVTVAAPPGAPARSLALVALGVAMVGAAALAVALWAWSTSQARSSASPRASVTAAMDSAEPVAAQDPSSEPEPSASAEPTGASTSAASPLPSAVVTSEPTSTTIPAVRPGPRPRPKSTATAFLPSKP